MATDTFKNMVTAFVFIMLIIFLAVGFIGNMFSKYDMEDDVVLDRLQYDRIENILNDSQSTADDWRESFEKQNIFSLVAGIVVTGIFGIGKQMLDFIFLPFNILSVVIVDLLGFPEIVFSIITFLLIVGAIFGIWSLLKKGD